jgi:hypothetical protein
MSLHIPNRAFTDAHAAKRDYFVSVPVGFTVEDLLVPDAWRHLVYALKISDRIEVVAEDGSFDGVLRVIAKGEHGVTVRIITMSDYTVQPQVAPSPDASSFAGAATGWGGPSQRFRIVLADGSVAETGFATKEDAEVRLASLKAA